MFTKLVSVFLLTAFFSSTLQAAYIGNQNYVECAGGAVRRYVPLKIRVLRANLNTASGYAKFMDANSNAVYTPSGGNQFCVLAYRNLDVNGVEIRLVTGTADSSGTAFSTGSVPTSAYYEYQFSTAAAPTSAPFGSYNFSGSLTPQMACTELALPNGRFLYAYGSGSTGRIEAYGYEAPSCIY